MPIKKQAARGKFYNAGNDQLRMVTKISKDDQGRKRVHYLSKSQKIKNKPFSYGSSKSNPPLMGTFMKACNYELSPSEVSQLRKTKVILNDE